MFVSARSITYSIFLARFLWTGDALALCTSGFPPKMLFDVIDTSNVSDHIGLLNVLVSCAPRLKKYVNCHTKHTLWIELVKPSRLIK